MYKHLITICIMLFILTLPAFSETKGNPDDIMAKGIALYKEGSYEDAIEKFKEVLGKDSNYAMANYAIATCYTKLDKTEMAIEFYEKALDIYNSGKDSSQLNAAYTYCDLGICYRKLGKVDKAIESYEKSLDLDKKDPLTYNNLAGAYFYKGNYEKVIEMSEKVLELDKTGEIKNHSYYWMGMANKELKNYKEAIKNFQKYLELSPDAKDAMEIKGYIKELENK